MTADLKELMKARLPVVHFVCVSILGLVLVSLSYVFFIPLIYWFLYGEGEASVRIAEQPINIFLQEWGGLVIALLLCGILLFRAFRLRPEKAKSYLLAGGLLLFTYPFRQEIGDFIFNIFQ